jgi:uncharacterized protein (TIGR00369 family)
MTSEAILEQLNGNWPPCSSLLGAHAVAWDGQSQELTLSFTVDERFCHSGDVVQGGFITSMLDATMAFAALSADAAITDIPSLEIKVSFIAPGRPGTLVCRAWPVRIGGAVAFMESDLRQGDTLVATSSSTFRVIRRKA